MVIDTRQKTLEGSISDVRGPSRVHAATVGTTSTATHMPPIIHAVEVQQAMLDVLCKQHARHEDSV